MISIHWCTDDVQKFIRFSEGGGEEQQTGQIFQLIRKILDGVQSWKVMKSQEAKGLCDAGRPWRRLLNLNPDHSNASSESRIGLQVRGAQGLYLFHYFYFIHL